MLIYFFFLDSSNNSGPPTPPELSTSSVPLTPTPSPASPQFPPMIDVDQQTDSNSDTALTLAAAGGHDELVTLLLVKGSDIEHRDKKGRMNTKKIKDNSSIFELKKIFSSEFFEGTCISHQLGLQGLDSVNQYD